MAETYCGKSCADCGVREQLACPGCKLGPAQRFQCTCELGKCCQEKHHETCDSCNASGRCGLYRSRERMPEYRIKRMQLDAQQAESAAKRAPFLGKWLWLLFWLIVPSILANLGSQDVIAGWSPTLYWGATGLGLLCEIAYGIILLRLSPEEPYYKTAGISCLVIVAISLLIPILAQSALTRLLAVIINIALLILGIVRTYYELHGHAAVTDGTNNELSERWRELWKWMLGSSVAVIASILLMLLIPLMGSIALIVSTIVVLLAGIAKLVLLYRTAKWFRSYPVE